MKYNTIIFLLFIIMSIFGSSSGSMGDDYIKVSISDFPPISIIDDNLASGIDAEIAVEIAHRMNKQIKFYHIPWKRTLVMMEKGEIDMIGGTLLTNDRVQYMHYINPSYLQVNMIFYLKSDSDLEISRYEDLYKYLLGYSAGSRHFLHFDSDAEIHKQEFYSLKRMFLNLYMGRIDAVIGPDTMFDYLLLNMGEINEFINTFSSLETELPDSLDPSMFKKASYKYPAEEVYFTISRKSVYINQASRFSQIMQALKDEGYIDKITEKYLKPNNKPQKFPLSLFSSE